MLSQLEWLSLVVMFGAGLAFGVLAHRSPKSDWEYIKGGPAFILLVLSSAVAQVEMAPRFVPGVWDFACERRWDPVELTMVTDCVDRSTPGHFEQPELTISDWIGGTVRSVLIDTPAEVSGVAIGIWLARQRPKDVDEA